MKKFERKKSNKDKNEEFPLYIFGIVFVYFVIMCVITVFGLSTTQKPTLILEKPKSEVREKNKDEALKFDKSIYSIKNNSSNSKNSFVLYKKKSPETKYDQIYGYPYDYAYTQVKDGSYTDVYQTEFPIYGIDDFLYDTTDEHGNSLP